MSFSGGGFPARACGLRQGGADAFLPVCETDHGNCNKKKEFTFLTDRKGKTFPVWSDCSVCMNIIYNTAPLDLSDQEQEIRALAPAGIRLSFTTETAEEAEKIAETYARRFLFGEVASMKLPEFTRGHFKRGVE